MTFWQKYDPFNKLLSSQNTDYTNDASGNRTKKVDEETGEITEYQYDALNRLTQISKRPAEGEPETLTATYRYDAFNRRVEKTVTDHTEGSTETTEFLWLGSRLVAEYKNGSSQPSKRYRYAHGFAPISYTESAQHYSVHSDHLDTPKRITDSQGTTVWETVLSPYGIAAFDADANNGGTELAFNLRFPGQYHDQESELYYNLNRTYDPEQGRYLQSDPIGLAGGLNSYAYVYNNPVVFHDPYGLWAWGDPLNQGVVDFSAGFGDTISFGATDLIRDQMGTNSAVDKCSGGYGAGEWAGIGYGFAAGGAGGWRAAGQKARGMEFSHWIPHRMGGPRSKWNGNYVTPNRHYKHDPFRYPRRNQRSGDKWPAPMQQLDRIPNVYKGAAAGGAAAGASAAGNYDCGCP